MNATLDELERAWTDRKSIRAFRPELMKQPVFGLTLAVFYGLGLIVAAVVLAVVYLLLCTRETTEGRA